MRTCDAWLFRTLGGVGQAFDDWVVPDDQVVSEQTDAGLIP